MILLLLKEFAQWSSSQKSKYWAPFVAGGPRSNEWLTGWPAGWPINTISPIESSMCVGGVEEQCTTIYCHFIVLLHASRFVSKGMIILSNNHCSTLHNWFIIVNLPQLKRTCPLLNWPLQRYKYIQTMYRQYNSSPPPFFICYTLPCQ